MPSQVMPEQDFYELLEVLRVEQVMGMSMMRQSDIPFDATLLQAGHLLKEFYRGGLRQKENGDLVLYTLDNTLSEAPQLQRDVEHYLSLQQAELVAALFGCFPHISFGDAQTLLKLKETPNPRPWLDALTTVLNGEYYQTTPSIEREMALAKVHSILLSYYKAGRLTHQHPEHIWQMLCSHLKIPT